jgi:hypothetical protein
MMSHPKQSKQTTTPRKRPQNLLVGWVSSEAKRRKSQNQNPNLNLNLNLKLGLGLGLTGDPMEALSLPNQIYEPKHNKHSPSPRKRNLSESLALSAVQRPNQKPTPSLEKVYPRRQPGRRWKTRKMWTKNPGRVRLTL